MTDSNSSRRRVSPISCRRMRSRLGIALVGKNTAISCHGNQWSNGGWKSSEMTTGMQPCAITSYSLTLFVCEDPRNTKQKREDHILSRYAASPCMSVDTSKPGTPAYNSSMWRRAHEFGEPAKNTSTGRPPKRAERSLGANLDGMEMTVSYSRKFLAGNISLASATGTVSARQQSTIASTPPPCTRAAAPLFASAATPAYHAPLVCNQDSLPVSDPTLQCSSHAALLGKSWRPKSMLKTVQKFRPPCFKCSGVPCAQRRSGTKYSTSATSMASQ
mmetsp:Transcript_93809/g.264982  ORF Transcript_93809/g.264982 Transcript_93809/m.264982 type:complete len:274 (+) Transcript_93809:904-1725(+)